jgi:tetratricopeptide (TPR) repeat protein
MTSKFQHTGDTTYIKLALNLFNQALKVDPEYIGVIGGKALLYREAQIFDSAMFYSRRIYELDPMSNPGAIGLTYLYMNKPDSAYKYLTKAVDLAPNDAWLNLAMGQVLLQYLNEPVKGLKYYQNAYDFMDVSDASLNGQIAWAFELIGDYSKAGKYVYKALSQSSECYFIYQYDYLLIGQGKYDEALHFLDSTCSVNPCEPICDITRFIIYASKKDFQEAEKYYNKNTIPQNFRNGVPDIYIAYLYKETDRKKEAFSILNDLIKVNEGWLKNTIGGIDMMWYKLDLAAAYALLDENEKALQYLRELEKLGTIEGAFNLKTFPGFDNLRNDPEFKAIVKSIEDKRAAIREKVKEMEQRGEINL